MQETRKLRKQQRISGSKLTSREKQTILKSMKALRAVWRGVKLRWEFEHAVRNRMGKEIWSIYNAKYFGIWTFYT